MMSEHSYEIAGLGPNQNIGSNQTSSDFMLLFDNRPHLFPHHILHTKHQKIIISCIMLFNAKTSTQIPRTYRYNPLLIFVDLLLQSTYGKTSYLGNAINFVLLHEITKHQIKYSNTDLHITRYSHIFTSH